MLFNSVPFAIFAVIVFMLFYFPFKGNSKWQSWLLLIASYFFYGYVNVKMIPLILLTTTMFFFLAKLVYKSTNIEKKAVYTTVGVLTGVGVLFYYKYFNFLMDSVNQLFGYLNIVQANWRGFNIIMPLGISFFTFKLVSYIVEVNRGKIEPIGDFVAFAAYISFFPTIISGPIDKPNTFLPQLKKYHYFDYNLAVNGCKQILWGAFQKMVIADNLAIYTSHAWNNIEVASGSTLVIAAVLFTFQMYTDFSGYSDMAIGIGKLLGFNITRNFNYPFFATNMAEYWRRWHISLTSWLTDYVFMPLNISFRNMGNAGMILAIVINMVLVGIWHGANWTFAVFGLYHGLLFIPLIISGSFMKKNKLKETKSGFPVFSDLMKMMSTFALVAIGLVIFNSKDLGTALDFFKGIFSASLLKVPYYAGMEKSAIAVVFMLLFIVVEWKGKKNDFAIADIGLKRKSYHRYAFYFLIILLIACFGNLGENQFIYFQF